MERDGNGEGGTQIEGERMYGKEKCRERGRNGESRRHERRGKGGRKMMVGRLMEDRVYGKEKGSRRGCGSGESRRQESRGKRGERKKMAGRLEDEKV